MYFYFVLCCFLGFTSKNKYVNRYSFSSDYDWERWTYRVYIYFKRKLSISGKCFGRPSNFYTTEKISLVWKQFEKQKEKEREGAAIWTKKKILFCFMWVTKEKGAGEKVEKVWHREGEGWGGGAWGSEIASMWATYFLNDPKENLRATVLRCSFLLRWNIFLHTPREFWNELYMATNCIAKLVSIWNSFSDKV